MWESESVFQPKKTFTHQTLLDARAHLQRVGLPRREEGGDAEDDVVALKIIKEIMHFPTLFTLKILFTCKLYDTPYPSGTTAP